MATNIEQRKEILREQGKQVASWALPKIAEREAARDWSSLPSDYESEAVAALFVSLNLSNHLRNHIRPRINCSKALTFAELRAAVESAGE